MATETDEVQRAAAPRSRWVLALVILGSLIVLIATFTTWVEQQALDTDAVVSVTDELLADDEIRAALSAYLVDELYESADLDGYVADILPNDFEGLAPLVSGALRGPAIDAVDALLGSDVVERAWTLAVREAHSTLVAVIEDDTGDLISTAEGVVNLDLGELLRALAEEVGLSGDRLDELPDDAGKVVLFESDELGTVQTAVKISKLVGALLLIAVIASFAGAIYLARGHRRRTLRDCGIGISTAALLVLIGRALGIDFLVDRLRRSTDEEPAKSVIEISSSLLRQVALTDLLIGLAFIAFAVAVGPTPAARRMRALVAPALRHGPVASVIGGTAIFIILLWLKPGGPIDGWIIALGAAGSCVAGVEWIRRVTVAELPRHA